MTSNNKTPETRGRNLRAAFLSDLTAGILSGLTETVRADSDLLLCFRGGLKPEYINVYFMGHSLFKIAKRHAGCHISFNFNHARYTKDWEAKATTLRGLGYTLGELKGPRKSKKGKVYLPSNELHILLTKSPANDFWAQSISLLKDITKDFFTITEGMTKDYFKEKFNVAAGSKGKSGLLEKRRQQQIMSANTDISGEYFIYDMEYDQARKSTTDTKSGRFDMLALRRVELNKFALVFIELKCTKSACGGKSGIKKHKDDLEVYKTKINQIKTREIDAVEIYKQYAIVNGIANTIEPEIIGIELLFIFTDEATTYADTPDVPQNEKIVLKNDYKLSYPGKAKTITT